MSRFHIGLPTPRVLRSCLFCLLHPWPLSSGNELLLHGQQGHVSSPWQISDIQVLSMANFSRVHSLVSLACWSQTQAPSISNYSLCSKSYQIWVPRYLYFKYRQLLLCHKHFLTLSLLQLSFLFAFDPRNILEIFELGYIQHVISFPLCLGVFSGRVFFSSEKLFHHISSNQILLSN